MTIYKVYKVTNRLNGKLYVGQTKQLLEKRFMQHLYTDSPLGQAMHECGTKDFNIEVIEYCESQQHLNKRERFWIRVLNSKIPNGYNVSDGGSSGANKNKPSILNYEVTVKLGQIIREYRKVHDMSMGDFATLSGISKPYVSMIEANKNSRDGKPIVPSIATLQKVSRAIKISLNDLLRMLDDDAEINLQSDNLNDEQIELLNGYDSLPEESKGLVMGMIRQLNFNRNSSKNNSNKVIQKNSGGKIGNDNNYITGF